MQLSLTSIPLSESPPLQPPPGGGGGSFWLLSSPAMCRYVPFVQMHIIQACVSWQFISVGCTYQEMTIMMLRMCVCGTFL